MEEFVCCLCGEKCKGYGNNPDGATGFEFKTGNERCCDKCNTKYVIPGRMKALWSIRQEIYGTSKKEDK